jgi:tRNA A-37 threonylcarbamoyl transferase component Bud32
MADTNRPDHDDALEAALEKTAPASEFSAEGLRRELEATARDAPPEETRQQYLNKTHTDTSEPLESTADITEFGETRDLPPDMLEEETAQGPRYAIVGEVGTGATSHVYEVRDSSLNRTIAVKFLRKSREAKPGVRSRFVREARVTAMLEHPNIMPVHDIGLTEKNDVFFAMKKVSGRTLGDAIRAAKKGDEIPDEFRTFDGRVRIFLKVCDALTYAHHEGFIHQDVKPDNMMLGEFGEVLLLDWGSALRRRMPVDRKHKGLFGTPAYMSPEQARRERADERSDVYCLGTTLFHALHLRHPMWADKPEVFWEKKRAGAIDPLTAEERRAVPPALTDIALKAMAAEPAQRYQSIAALADDLKRYQAGRAVGAHRETLLETFLRWYRHNTRFFWTVLLAVVVAGSIGGLLFREKIQEFITWRRVFVDEFSYSSSEELAEHWVSYASFDWWNASPEPFSDSGGWRVEDGALHGHNLEGFHNLAYRGRIAGDMRVEWEVTPLRNSLDLNCYIGGETRLDGYMFHVATRSPRHCNLNKGQSGLPLDRTTLDQGFKVGRTYRFRMEKEGKHVRLLVDG